MTDKCSEVRDAIALEGKAPENEGLLEHVNECTECARFLDSVLAVESELGTLAAANVDDAVVEKLLARPELSAKTSSHKLRWAMGLAAAATIAFMAARVTLLGRANLMPSASYDDAPESGFVGGAYEGEHEEASRLESLGYVGDDAENRPDEQRLADTRARDAFVVPTMEAPQETERELQSRVQDLNRSYSRSGSDGNEAYELENKNESLKKDMDVLLLKRGASEAVSGDGPVGAPSAAEPALRENPRPSRQAAAAPVPQPPPPPPPPATPRNDESDVFADTELGGLVDGRLQQEKLKETVAVDKAQVTTEGFRSRLLTPNVTVGNADRIPDPQKLVHVDAVYPESAKAKRLSGIVVLRLVIDRGGNVTQAIVVDSVEDFDQAAIGAVLQWKYEASEREQRSAVVRIAFEAPTDPDDDARLFLEERERIDNLRFRDASGYWANTYLPGDAKARFLAMRLRNADQLVAPHLSARPVVQPFDAPTRGALSVTLHADQRGVSGRERLLLQVGIKATENYGRRRPPMNVGIVLDADPNDLAAARALVDSLQQAKALGDRFRLIVPGKGEVVSPETFQHGALAVALDELQASTDLENAVRLAVERVHAGDDPTMPLGSSLVLVITPRKLGAQLDTLSRLAHQSAVGGVPVSVVGVGAGVDRDELERLALSGQGRRYFLDQAADATGIVDRELAASSRVVARALRLRIKLAADVQLVDVIGSESLSERQAEQVREAEKSIDLRLSRNLGIEADRGEDEDGIQIVIPSFYAGDTHTILLDVVVARPGPIAEVTARFKDLSELRNTVAKASLSLSRSEAAPGPLETNVLKNYLSHRLSEELESAADELERGERDAAVVRLRDTRALLEGLGFGNDRELARDIAMLGEYVGVLSSSLEPALISYIADSLRYAGASKRRLSAALT